MFSEYDQLVVPDTSTYGLASTRTSTVARATLSEAVPLTLIVPDTVAPAEGDLIATLGRVVSAETCLAAAPEPGANAIKRKAAPMVMRATCLLIRLPPAR